MGQQGSDAGEPGNRRDHVAKAWQEFHQAFKKRDYEQALISLLPLLDLPDNSTAPASPAKLRELVGVTLLRLRRTEDGVAHLERAVELDPKSARANFKLGLGYGRLRREQDALCQFERTLALEPDNPEYLCRYARQLKRLDRRDEAISACLRALRSDPAYQDALIALGEMGVENPAQRLGEQDVS